MDILHRSQVVFKQVLRTDLYHFLKISNYKLRFMLILLPNFTDDLQWFISQKSQLQNNNIVVKNVFLVTMEML